MDKRGMLIRLTDLVNHPETESEVRIREGHLDWATSVVPLLPACMILTYMLLIGAVGTSNGETLIDDVASLLLEYYDAVIYGEVTGMQPKHIYNLSGRCTWVTEIEIQPLRQLWGECKSEKIRVLTLSLPEDLRQAGPGGPPGCAFISQGYPPPEVGEQCVFLLSGLSDGYFNGFRIAKDATFVVAVQQDVIPVSSDGTLAIFKDGMQQERRWALDDFSDALERAASRLSLSSLIHRSSTIALVNLVELHGDPRGAWSQRMVVATAYKGTAAGDTLDCEADVTPGGQDNARDALKAHYAGVLLWKLQKSRVRRAIYFGWTLGQATGESTSGRWVPVNQDDVVMLPSAVLIDGQIERAQIALSSLTDEIE